MSVARLFRSTNEAMLEEAEWLQYEGEVLRKTKKSKPLRVSVAAPLDKAAAAEYVAMWLDHERAWAAFEADEEISRSIPWPPCDADILEFMGRANPGLSPKEIYRLACRRWHPDRWQRFLSGLPEMEQAEVIERVNAVFQALSKTN
jgi:hypothetical protein